MHRLETWLGVSVVWQSAFVLPHVVFANRVHAVVELPFQQVHVRWTLWRLAETRVPARSFLPHGRMPIRAPVPDAHREITYRTRDSARTIPVQPRSNGGANVNPLDYLPTNYAG